MWRTPSKDITCEGSTGFTWDLLQIYSHSWKVCLHRSMWYITYSYGESLLHCASDAPEIENRDFQMSGNPDFRRFGSPGIRKSGFSVSRKSDFCNSGKPENPDFRMFRCSGFPENRKIQKYGKRASDVEFSEAFVWLSLNIITCCPFVKNHPGWFPDHPPLSHSTTIFQLGLRPTAGVWSVISAQASHPTATTMFVNGNSASRQFYIRCPGNRKIGIFGNPDFRRFRSPDIWKSGFSDSRKSRFSEIGFPEKNLGFSENNQVFRFPGFSENRKIQKSCKKTSDVEFACVEFPVRNMVIR